MITRLASVLLRTAALVGCWVALGALLHRAPTAAENAVDIGAGIARIAGLVLVVVLGAAFDSRRHGFTSSVRTWVSVLAVLAVAALVAVLVPAATGSPSAEPLGVVLPAMATLVAVLLVPAGALALAAAAVGDRTHRGHPAPH